MSWTELVSIQLTNTAVIMFTFSNGLLRSHVGVWNHVDKEALDHSSYRRWFSTYLASVCKVLLASMAGLMLDSIPVRSFWKSESWGLANLRSRCRVLSVWYNALVNNVSLWSIYCWYCPNLVNHLTYSVFGFIVIFCHRVQSSENDSKRSVFWQNSLPI